MLKTLKEMKQKDDIEFKRFSDKVNYQVKTFGKENDSKMKKLNSQRKLNNKSKQQSSLWANAIKNGKL
ncbi:hypothetical protein MT438_07430 [Staphylococcus warneri]|uniref:hypothetical protein n=1 Tax=Staphylococcus warneri TaxID=1292 RepID=UPI001FB1FA4D|nr:hypothetical protein [Staphylococcus warneri]MCJ1787161.1 hypothetical protein [Staphylococcus warneri]MCJ1799458.1 hypothetical protein [Staphylococcus warneri]